jgi:hypothetical protein
LVKKMVLPCLMASLIGGLAGTPVAIKTDASVHVGVTAEAAFRIVPSGIAKAKPKGPKPVKARATAKATTNGEMAKGARAMKNSVSLKKTSGWWAASCLGRQAPYRGRASGC